MGNGLLQISHPSSLHDEFFARQISGWEINVGRNVGIDRAHELFYYLHLRTNVVEQLLLLRFSPIYQGRDRVLHCRSISK
jgi:hypothetical protein